MLLCGILGACIAGIPLTASLIYQNQHSESLRAQVSAYKKEKEESRYLTVWTLKRDISAGDPLTKADIEKKEVWIRAAEDINELTDLEQITGKCAKTALTKGTIVQSDLFYEGQPCTDDVRVKEITFVQLPVQLEENEYVDIRISYPDGEDYIVVKHKKVLGLLRDNTQEQQIVGIRLEFTEEELLRLSSAQIDVRNYAETTLYAIQYREDFQSEAVPFYPINENVFQLLEWDPNVIDRSSFSGERKRRKVLEQNMVNYRQKSEGSVSQEQSQQNTVAGPSDMTETEESSDLEIFE